MKNHQDLTADPATGGNIVNPLVRQISLCWLRLKSKLLRHRIVRPVLEKVADRHFLLIPEVLNPVVFRSGKYFAGVIAGSKVLKPLSGSMRSHALDMGTGCGICAVFAAGRGYRVTGVDINPDAVRCARANVLLNNMETEVEIRHGDLFAPVKGERFELILFNPPFFRGIPGSNLEMAWRSSDIFERFAAGLDDALTSDGQALVLLSTDGEPSRMMSALHANNMDVGIFDQRHFGNEIMTIYRVRRK